jgi:hypothetical protein
MDDGSMLCGLCSRHAATVTTEGGNCTQCDTEAAAGRRYCKKHKSYAAHEKFVANKKTCEVRAPCERVSRPDMLVFC